MMSITREITIFGVFRGESVTFTECDGVLDQISFAYAGNTAAMVMESLGIHGDGKWWRQLPSLKYHGKETRWCESPEFVTLEIYIDGQLGAISLEKTDYDNLLRGKFTCADGIIASQCLFKDNLINSDGGVYRVGKRGVVITPEKEIISCNDFDPKDDQRLECWLDRCGL